MEFFIDTANLDQIKEAEELGILDGVTTNPSLMAKEGITGQERIRQHYLAICEAIGGPVSAEVISTDFNGIVKEGEVLADLHPQIVAHDQGWSRPCGISAIRASQRIAPWCSVGQALLAAKLGPPMSLLSSVVWMIFPQREWP